MHRYAILYPLLAQVALTFVVWITMYVTRLREIRRKQIRADDLGQWTRARELLEDSAPAADNFRNLFEMPVLFYAVIVVLYITTLADTVYLALAWAFVALRAIHSLIHITINRVLWRFGVYVLSCLVLWLMWLRLAIALINSP